MRKFLFILLAITLAACSKEDPIEQTTAVGGAPFIKMRGQALNIVLYPNVVLYASPIEEGHPYYDWTEDIDISLVGYGDTLCYNISTLCHIDSVVLPVAEIHNTGELEVRIVDRIDSQHTIHEGGVEQFVDTVLCRKFIYFTRP